MLGRKFLLYRLDKRLSSTGLLAKLLVGFGKPRRGLTWRDLPTIAMSHTARHTGSCLHWDALLCFVQPFQAFFHASFGFVLQR